MEERATSFMNRYSDGLNAETVARRRFRRERIQAYFKIDDDKWQDWRW
jgi:hypothetical protein